MHQDIPSRPRSSRHRTSLPLAGLARAIGGVALIAALASGCGAGDSGAESAEASATASAPAVASPEPEITDEELIGGGVDPINEAGLYACRPPAVVTKAGEELVDEYCQHYRDMWGALTAMGSGGSLQVQQYLRTQGLLETRSGKHVVDWPTAKSRLDEAAERWKGTPQVILVDAARSAAFLDRADNGEFSAKE